MRLNTKLFSTFNQIKIVSDFLAVLILLINDKLTKTGGHKAQRYFNKTLFWQNRRGGGGQEKQVTKFVEVVN